MRYELPGLEAEAEAGTRQRFPSFRNSEGRRLIKVVCSSIRGKSTTYRACASVQPQQPMKDRLSATPTSVRHCLIEGHCGMQEQQSNRSCERISPDKSLVSYRECRGGETSSRLCGS